MALLRPCVQCGKKTFFLGLSEEGLCQACINENIRQEEIQRKADLQAATEFYHNLAYHWSMVCDPVCQSIDDIDYIKHNCELFTELAQRIPKYSRFQEVFQSRCSELNWYSCQNQDFGRMSVDRVDGNTVKIDFEQLITSANKKKNAVIQRFEVKQSFVQQLSSLYHVEIDVDKDAVPRTDRRSFQVETKNITSRTPISKLDPFYVVDIETTGLNPMTDEIIQLSAIKFINFEPVEAFSTYIKPRNGLNPRAQQINKITEEQVENAPYIEEVIKSFDQFLNPNGRTTKRFSLVGHNLNFDYSFLTANGFFSVLYGRNFYDTLELSRREYKDWSSYKLDYLCETILNLTREDSHDALSDALAAGLLFKKICQSRVDI